MDSCFVGNKPYLKEISSFEAADGVGFLTVGFDGEHPPLVGMWSFEDENATCRIQFKVFSYNNNMCK